jgi:hypothetical protein
VTSTFSDFLAFQLPASLVSTENARAEQEGSWHQPETARISGTTSAIDGAMRVMQRYHIDKKSIDGFYLCIFGLIHENQIIDRWVFAIDQVVLEAQKNGLLEYLERLESIVQVLPFKNSALPLNINIPSPRAIDFPGLSHTGRISEFAFYGWARGSASIAQLTTAQGQKPTISAHLYCILRCTVDLQSKWVKDIYADASL